MELKAIVLAGDRVASHPVFGKNKALLPLEGRALVAHVVRTLVDVPEISCVYIVGPPDKLAEALRDIASRADQPRHIVPQGQTLYDNAWRAFLRTLSPSSAPDEAALREAHEQTVIAVLPGDIPLATPHEIRRFLQRADLERYDYVVGVTPIEALAPFGPRAGHLGVRMAALHVAEGGFRQNNLHLVRPFCIGNKQYIEEFYEYRYQKEWWNALRLLTGVAVKHEGTLHGVATIIRMQLAMRADRAGWRQLVQWARQAVPMADVCRQAGRLLRTRFTTLVCHEPGAALDIDNEHDLAAMAENYRAWRRLLLADARV